MKTPFKISFEKVIKDINNKDILEEFQSIFEKTLCDKTEIVNNHRLLIKNRFFRLRRDSNLNLWVGIGLACVQIINEENNFKIIKYTIDFTKLSVAYIIYLVIFFLAFLFIPYDFDQVFKGFLVVFIVVGIIQHFVMILRHQSIFKRTIFHELEYTDDKDWKSILTGMKDSDLVDISGGKRDFPNPIIELAKKELLKREKV